MIKINLLPIRAAKKKETAIQQIVIFAAAVVVTLVLVLSFYFIKRAQISGTKNEITAAKAKISELEAKIGKLNDIEKLKEEVKRKLDILAQLRANKSGPAKRLATLSDVTPDQLWLTTYKEAGDSVKVAGLALNEELIAQFIRAVEASSDYEKVELLVSEQKDVSGTKFKHFELTFKLETMKQASKGK